MVDNAGRFYIYDGELFDASIEKEFAEKDFKEIYEVIRIIDGVPLFLEDHYERMTGSAMALGKSLPFSMTELSQQIKLLLEANSLQYCNVKTIAAYKSDKCNVLIYISKSYYPTDDIIRSGVAVGVLQLERQNPSVKLVNNEYKKTVNSFLQEGKFFEILLCNREGFITEGSKSNVFFVKGNDIYTAPGYAVLKGITRKYVIEACKSAGYNVKEEFVEASSLNKIKGIFLSGTSIKVLPVSSVDGQEFGSTGNPVIKDVGDEFDLILKRYIESNI